MSAAGFQVPAEFVGGPLCGMKLSLDELFPAGRTYIARASNGMAYAYESAERTTRAGRWVLRFVCYVGGPIGLPAPAAEQDGPKVEGGADPS